jgi:hypothetical protein
MLYVQYVCIMRTLPPRKSPSGSAHRKLERVIKTGAGIRLCGVCIYYSRHTEKHGERERERESESG